MIAIISKNRGLGKDNKLLFHIPGELKRFKEITMGHPVIMGRKTFESLNRPLGLPGRSNIIITHNSEYGNINAQIYHSLKHAIKRIKAQQLPGYEEIFIIGGGQIYEQAMPFADRLYLTLVDKDVDADTFFPDYSQFTKVIEKEEHENDEFKYTFLTREK